MIPVTLDKRLENGDWVYTVTLRATTRHIVSFATDDFQSALRQYAEWMNNETITVEA